MRCFSFFSVSPTAMALGMLNSLHKRDREVLIRFYLKEQSADRICREMELTETEDGRVYVRYLDHNAEPGDPRPAFLTVGTYPSSDPAAAVAAAQQQSGSLTEKTDSGQLLVSNEQRPTSVYFANPAGGVQVEVYDPKPNVALEAAKSGQVVALR